MSHTRKDIPQSQVELTITVEPDAYHKHLIKAAERISMRASIRGFRPGKAPYEIVKREMGEMNILQEALESIVQESFYEAVTAEHLDTVGMPDVKIQKIAPGNELVYTATVALLPEVKMASLDKIKVTKKTKPVTDEQVSEVVDNLRKLQAKEVAKDGQAGREDIVLIDMDMFIDSVPVDGGQAKNYRVYLSEDHYIPGFNKELVGLKKNESKKFSIKFPATHYQKHLAGKNVNIEINVKDVFERQLPELSEEFAKTLGQQSVEKLKDLLRTNLGQEAERKSEEQAEIEIFDTLIEKSEFGDIPEVLIDAERKKMFYELTRDLERHGISIEQYLNDIKKKEDELYQDFKTQAEKRAKAALLSRHIALQNQIAVSEEETDAELRMMAEAYKDNPEHLEQIKKPEVRGTIKNVIQNKKVIAWLKEKILGPAPKKLAE
ncbi:MAG: Trigger factor [Candidatus Magasanikbacteria bacterium GW2011_GWA2_56_11]|uniref:Trigger factor n=1 Tax=Candidatus Magasanikbacteria bacterium GW2011_GWA2_56_11 TaxID=1619044 RepID=A0A0G2AKZ2_9BACT|nr:MAG: Trigger factor [Candidatus Magasanikbacteria bacterium GW2011_GWA2_56_11]